MYHSPQNDVQKSFRLPLPVGWFLFLVLATGCQPFDHYSSIQRPLLSKDQEVPRELSMVCLPEYRIESPDMLQIEVLKLVPRSPYHIQTYDLLFIRAVGVSAGNASG